MSRNRNPQHNFRHRHKRLVIDDPRLIVYQHAFEYCKEHIDIFVGKAAKFMQTSLTRELHDISKMRYRGMKGLARQLERQLAVGDMTPIDFKNHQAANVTESQPIDGKEHGMD